MTDQTVTIRSRNDGEHGERGKTFASPCPNTYDILVGDKVVGQIFKSFGRRDEWAGFFLGTNGKVSLTHLYLRELKVEVMQAVIADQEGA